MIENPNAKVFSMFPTPLYSTVYTGDTAEIIKYFDSCEMEEVKDGAYGIVSKNTYVIDNPICKPLANFIMDCFKDFATNVMRYKYEELQFAQSWVTHKLPGQFHKAHTHPNTLLAGVFYYDTQPGDAAICFSKDFAAIGRPYLEPSLLDDFQQHPFSQEEMYFIPQRNSFIIFPSFVTHGVPPNTTNRVRKALGVNVLTKSTFGDQKTISEIIFGRYA
jgi:hypothetical protein